MPEFDLKNSNFEHWWKMIAAAGAAIALGSVAVKFAPTIPVGLGLLLFDAGEWHQHPKEKWDPTFWPFDRSTNFLGLLLDLVGVVCFFAGLARLLVISVV